MSNIRTDLALEAREMYQQNANQESEVPGVEVENAGSKDISVTRVKVTSSEGVEAMGKPMGSYITLEVPRLREKDQDLQEDVCKTLAKEIYNLIKIDKKSNVLVVGLGNWNVTPDALGPKVVSSLMVTRHLLEYIPEQIDEGVRPVCAIAPGVLGLTGIETGEIIRGIVDRVKPDLVIAIDALASRRLDRVSTTIQIADTGINPGSGVGNKRMGLTLQTLGVPVIAIGVPTVVDAATMANDTIDLVIDSMIKQVEQGSAFYETLKNMNRNDKYALIQEVLSPYIGNLMVTPKEVDTVIEDVSKIIANGINIALHEGIELDDVNRYVH
ncbi:GPR endopeptidase [Petroclostridium sp. X23]|uniref:GPR endopeptidase n=1 Tax=Petroclostridium sp. X23 TaxID=3045146 RepID=UPI0024AD19E7|nr:GPR endopeptidase [Petroclostridium sp. X23]WHH60434.1 GPR endopeptidase [Petroclostridium sp. X23]